MSRERDVVLNPPAAHDDDDDEDGDADYDPDREEKEDVSEEDESGDDVDDPLIQSGKRKKSQNEASNKISKLVDAPLDDEEEKKRSDALWADFVDEKKPVDTANSVGAEPAVSAIASSSKETPESATESKPIPPAVRPAVRKPGLADRLSALSKKKESVLTKSMKDWQQLKQEEGLVEELAEHTKSKDSFVERQAFLQRADVRQFEQEKSVRDKIRSRNFQP